MEKIKVSVIVPVWNQEKLLPKALYSIPQRNDLEIVIIDDGSTDNTSQVITDFISMEINKFANITLITNKKNLGLGLTVNKGYDKAKGEYIVNLDSDDYFYPEVFEEVMDNQLNGADIVYYNLESNDKHIWDLSLETRKGLCGAVKFIRREFMGDSRCPNARKGEDWGLNNLLLAKNPTEVFTHKVVKHYNYPRIGSLSNPSDYLYGLSIIIPAYNTIDNLKELIAKLVYQKDTFYPETEIIVINDGSTDDYSDIKDMRGIVYIEQKNSGVSAARNAGLDLATRNYVTFIDSDDDVGDNYLHTIYSNFHTKFPVYRLNWFMKVDGEIIGNTVLPYEESRDNIINIARSVMFYVYDHSLIKDKKFDTNYIVNEDYHWLTDVLPKQPNLYSIIKEPIYIYNLSNKDSLTHRYDRGEITERK